MSNLGLEKYLLNKLKIKLKRSSVGDINVIKEMTRYKSFLGGEQSGHIILSDFSKTGDGILAALKVTEIISKNKKLTSKIFNLYESYPQIKINIKYKKISTKTLSFIENLNKKKHSDKNIRILVRKSGTEPLIRLLVEGSDMKKAREHSVYLEKIIRNRLEQ